MAKKYTYTNTKTGKVLFETVEANYVSPDDVDKKMVASTKKDPRLDPFIQRQIRVVEEALPKKTGRYDRHKKGWEHNP